MKLKLILTTGIVGTAFALPSASSAQLPPPPTQDSVLLTEAPAFVGAPDFPAWRINELNATSGPSGENPAGHAGVSLRGFGAFLDGPVTCLAVRGNTATINFDDQLPAVPGIMTVQVVDDQPDMFNLFGSPFGFVERAPTDCSPAPFELLGLATGNITVVDAQQLRPTSKDQCKNGGWQQFGFRNQGQCVAFVERGPGPQGASGAG